MGTIATGLTVDAIPMENPMLLNQSASEGMMTKEENQRDVHPEGSLSRGDRVVVPDVGRRPDYIALYLEPIRNIRYLKGGTFGRTPDWLRERLRFEREMIG